MTLGKVIGSIVSTIKHECYHNKRIMLVRPIDPHGKEQKGTMVAVDAVGAGPGDVVLVDTEGRSATEIMGFPRRMPLRSVIIGIVDTVKLRQ